MTSSLGGPARPDTNSGQYKMLVPGARCPEFRVRASGHGHRAGQPPSILGSDRPKSNTNLTNFDIKLTRFQHRCVEGKSSDKLKLLFLIKNLVLNDGFKVATLLSTLLEELNNQVNLITLRDLSY